MRPVSTFFNIQLSNSREPLLFSSIPQISIACHRNLLYDMHEHNALPVAHGDSLHQRALFAAYQRKDVFPWVKISLKKWTRK